MVVMVTVSMAVAVPVTVMVMIIVVVVVVLIRFVQTEDLALAAGADAFHVVVMALLGRAHIGLEAEDLLPVLTELAIHELPPARIPRPARQSCRAPGDGP